MLPKRRYISFSACTCSECSSFHSVGCTIPQEVSSLPVSTPARQHRDKDRARPCHQPLRRFRVTSQPPAPGAAYLLLGRAVHHEAARSARTTCPSRPLSLRQAPANRPVPCPPRIAAVGPGSSPARYLAPSAPAPPCRAPSGQGPARSPRRKKASVLPADPEAQQGDARQPPHPLPVIASTRFLVPSRRRVLGLRGLGVPSTQMTDSCPLTAVESDEGSRTSPSAISTFAGRATFGGCRTRAVALWPLSSNEARTSRPSPPVAPTTKIFMTFSVHERPPTRLASCPMWTTPAL